MQKMRIKFKHLGRKRIRTYIDGRREQKFTRGHKCDFSTKDFGISFLQTEASLKKARGSERERATFECETIYVVPLEFIYKGNIELHECPVVFFKTAFDY